MNCNKRLNLIFKTPNISLGYFSYNLYKLFGPPQFFVAIFSCVRDKQGCCNLKYIVVAESHPLKKKSGWWLFCGNLLALANLFVAIFQQCHDRKWHFVWHDMAFILRLDDKKRMPDFHSVLFLNSPFTMLQKLSKCEFKA